MDTLLIYNEPERERDSHTKSGKTRNALWKSITDKLLCFITIQPFFCLTLLAPGPSVHRTFLSEAPLVQMNFASVILYVFVFFSICVEHSVEEVVALPGCLEEWHN